VDIWFRKNGTDIAASNSKFGLAPRKASGDPFHLIGAMNFYADLAANDYIQLMWRASDTGAMIEHYAAGTSPTRPITPSVIATVNLVSLAASTNIYASSQGQGTATITHFANSTANKTYRYAIIG
jgi:hypothetical protein